MSGQSLYLMELLRFLDVSEHMLGECVQYVQTVDLVAARDRQVEADQRHRVGLGDAQRRVQRRDEVGELAEVDELGGVRVVSVGGADTSQRPTSQNPTS